MILETLHAPLRGRNTFGIDATARLIKEYTTVDDLRSLAPVGEPFLHIGGGSNLLFAGDCPTLLLHSLISGIEILSDSADAVLVRVGAGVVWDDFVAWAVASGLSGVENLSIIPGETGAAAVQNIGAYGTEVKDVVEAVDTVDMASGAIRSFSREECRYAYRHSVFKLKEMKRHVVTHVTFRLSHTFVPNLSYSGLAEYFTRTGLQPTLSAVRRAVIALRHSKLPDPTRLGNAGSFFTNPVVSEAEADALSALHPAMPRFAAPGGRVKLSAGWMIEKAGWKGRSIGPAGVYDRQALVIVNHGGASGAQIMEVAQAVVRDVKEMFGVTLTPEVNLIEP